MAGCGSHARANASGPTRATPLGSARGWFRAINDHDRRRLLFYVAADARDQMGWARPAAPWPKFTDLRCRDIKTATLHARVRCTFHELGSLAVVGNRDNFWDVYLRHTSGAWLIDGYGQG